MVDFLWNVFPEDNRFFDCLNVSPGTLSSLSNLILALFIHKIEEN